MFTQLARQKSRFVQSEMEKPPNYLQLRWTLSKMVTLIGASALTQSRNHWNPLKGLYLRNVLLVSQKEDSGYIACQELLTGAKTEVVASMISLLNTQHSRN